jgi:type II secretory pathway pseudopilin PulG
MFPTNLTVAAVAILALVAASLLGRIIVTKAKSARRKAQEDEAQVLAKAICYSRRACLREEAFKRRLAALPLDLRKEVDNVRLALEFPATAGG